MTCKEASDSAGLTLRVLYITLARLVGESSRVLQS
jgi:hypothetical protein